MTPAADMIARKPGEAGRWLRARLAAGAELSADSRDIRPGDGFVAMPGERHDGRDYIGQAQVGGAAAIAYDPAGGAQPVTGVPAIAVAGLRRDAGLVAAEYYGRPSSRLRVVAITGTNGKTSCSQWIAQGWSAMGRRAGVVGDALPQPRHHFLHQLQRVQVVGNLVQLVFAQVPACRNFVNGCVP